MNSKWRCTICKSEHVKSRITVTREDKYKASFVGENGPPATYSECGFCKAFVFDGSPHSLGAYSEGSYYSVDGDPQEFLSKRFQQIVNLPVEKSDNIARVSRIRSFLSQHWKRRQESRRVLDIGSGMGVFLHELLKEKRWEAEAVEPEPHAASFLRSRFPQVVVHEGFSTDVRHEHTFDLITLNRVVEHIPEPLEALKAERGNLGRDGVLYLELPDSLSYERDGANNEAFGYGHFIIYSPTALSILADQAGYNLVHLQRVQEPSTKYTLYGFLM